MVCDVGFLGLAVRAWLYPKAPKYSSFLGSPYRILNMNPQQKLLWGLWVSQY